MKTLVVGGNDAIAYAVSKSQVDVVSAYPITPQTSIIEKIAGFIAAGQMHAKFIKVESEHSAMAACIGASAAGGRVFTATSAQGLLLMHEVLHWAAGANLPIVMANANRALAPPWSIWAEQTDSLSQRDTGWIQLYASNSQEAYDLVFLAFRTAEESLVPAMVCMDGFLLTHTKEPITMFDDEIEPFISKRTPRDILDVSNPKAFGSLAFPKDYMPVKIKQHKGMLKALDIFEEVAGQFNEISDRSYSSICQYGDGTDVAIVTMGSIAETAHLAVDRLNNEGIKSRLVKITMFRPFPKKRLAEALKGVEHVVVFDRNISHGKGGIIKDEVTGALGLTNSIGFVCGLGGYDVTEEDMIKSVKGVLEGTIKEDTILWSEA